MATAVLQNVMNTVVNVPFPTVSEFLFGGVLFGSFLGYMALGSKILPGRVYDGTEIRDAKNKPYRLQYKCNGLLLYVVVCVSYILGAYHGLFPGSLIYDHIVGLAWFVNAWAFLLSFVLYVKGKVAPEKNMKPHYSGNPIKDFWMGVELNPHILGFDTKFFAYRPAMAGWTMVNLSLLFTQVAQHGAVSWNMAAYQLMSFLYVFDYFWHEPLMISTWDIIAENFGFMLVWGDYVFITFCFSLQSWYLVDYPSVAAAESSQFMKFYLVGALCLWLLGYTIFRGANAQKAAFKFNTSCKIWGKPAVSMPTERGTKLLLSGWWGLARHANYTGDILMGIAYSMPCMDAGFFAYLYPMYLTALLIDRAQRDDRKCAEKYGKDWEKYCKRVPKVFIPGIL
eukprot:ANDGO_00593.mRNA.1 Delta(14)-sterol reductase